MDPSTLTTSLVLKAKRPSDKELKALRQAMLEIVFMYLKESMSSEEAHSILLYILDCKDDKQLANLLQMLVSLLAKPQHPIIKHFNSLDPFIGLLDSTNENLRVWTLKVIGKLLEHNTGKQKEQMIANNRFAAMKKHLQAHRVTATSYFGYMEILLENISISNAGKAIDPNEKGVNFAFRVSQDVDKLSHTTTKVTL